MTHLAAADLLRPWALAAVPLLAALAVVLWRRARTPRLRASLLVRTVAILALVLALARPRLFTRVEDLAVAFVLDVSQSVPREARERAQQRIAAWFAGLRGRDTAGLVVFGEQPSIEVPFTAAGATGDAAVAVRLDGIESRVAPAQSDLARALRFAEGAFPRGRAKRIVLLSDGNSTRGDLDAAARALAAAGVRLDVVPLTYRYEEEVVADGLHGPAGARLDEPVQLRGVVTARAATDAEVVLLQDGEPAAAETVRLDPGTNVLRWNVVPRAAGFRQYEMVVRPARDGNPANNVARAGLIAGGEGTTIVVAPPGEDDRIAAALLAAGLPSRAATPAQLPRHPAGWIGVHAAVLHNVPAFQLDAAQIEALRDAVRELGLGLVVAGGDQSFGPGGYRGTPIEDLLPVSLDTRHRRKMPKGALVVILHSIEFDSGNTWAARICKSSIKALEPTDEAGVVYYDGTRGDRWLFDLTTIGDGQKLLGLIDGVFVGDMPSFHNCFVLAEASLGKSDAAVKHVVVISDGDPQAPDPALLKRLRAMPVTVSTICIEPHMGGEFRMQDIATAGGGRFHLLQSGSLKELPKLLLKEAATLRRSAVVERPFRPLVTLPGSPLLRGIGDAWPQLLGRVVTSARPEAETILLAEGEDEDPLLAAWHAGLGRVVAFTSDASSRWAREWLGWEKFVPFWSQVVRSTISEGVRSPYPLAVEADGLGFRVRLEAIDEAGAAETGLEIAGAAMTEGREPVEIRLRQTEPGRYLAAVEVPAPGHWLLRLSWKDAEGKPAQALAAAAIDYGPEDRALQSDEGALAAAAARTGGRVLAAADDPFAHDLTGVEDLVEVWPRLLLFAAVLLVLDLAVRRFDVSVRRLFRRKIRTAAAPAPAPESASAPAPAPAPAFRDVPPPAAKPPAPPASPRPAPSPADTLEELKRARQRAEERRRWK